MAIYTDFRLHRREDGIIQIELVPDVNIGGWDIQFNLQRFPSSESGFAYRYGYSGYGGGESGITIVNSGQGIFNVDLRSVDTSGLATLNYFHKSERVSSGFRTRLSEGWLTLNP